MSLILHDHPHSEKGYPGHQISAEILRPRKGFDQNVSEKNPEEDIRGHQAK
jgi:hypothetical protein